MLCYRKFSTVRSVCYVACRSEEARGAGGEVDID